MPDPRSSFQRFRTWQLISLVAVCLAVAAVVLMAHLRTRSAPNGEASSGVSGTSNPKASTEQHRGSNTQRPDRARRLTEFGRMAQVASSSPDLQSFVEEAQKRPSEGGVAYAIVAIERCAQERRLHRMLELQFEQIAATDPNVAARRRALTAEAQRCTGFNQVNLQDAADRLSKGAQTDPIASAKAKVGTVATYLERRELSLQIMQMEDPHLLARLPLLTPTKSALGMVPHLDGEPYGGIGTAQFSAAVSLVPCAFGDVCDDANESVVRACTNYGVCAKDTFDLYKKIYADRPQDYEKILSAFNRLTTVVRVKDVDALTAPSESGRSSQRPAERDTSAVPPVPSR